MPYVLRARILWVELLAALSMVVHSSMGVTGLWQLLEPAAQPVTLESLEGQRLAIDVSLWLHQSVRGAAGHNNRGLNPHLQTVFQRLVKLLFYRIRPVFVFDGTAIPVFKQRVLNERRMRRQLANNKLSRTHKQILRAAAQKVLLDSKELNKQEIVEQLLSAAAAGDRQAEELYQIHDELDLNKLSYASSDEDEMSDTECGGSDDSFEAEQQACSSSTYEQQAQIDDPAFDQLPIELRRDLLRERHDAMKQSRLHRSHIPDDANQFSQFQLERLRQRNSVMQKFLKVGQEFNERLAASALSGSPEKAGSRVRSMVREGGKRHAFLISAPAALTNFSTLGQNQTDATKVEKTEPADHSPPKALRLAETPSKMTDFRSALESRLTTLRETSLELLAEVVNDSDDEQNEDTENEDSTDAADLKATDDAILRSTFDAEPELQAAIFDSISSNPGKSLADRKTQFGSVSPAADKSARTQDVPVNPIQVQINKVNKQDADKTESDQSTRRNPECTKIAQEEHDQSPTDETDDKLITEGETVTPTTPTDERSATAAQPEPSPAAVAQSEDPLTDTARQQIQQKWDRLQSLLDARRASEEDDFEDVVGAASPPLTTDAAAPEPQASSTAAATSVDVVQVPKRVVDVSSVDDTPAVTSSSAEADAVASEMHTLDELRSQASAAKASAQSITDAMYTDTQRLLALFGVPFVVAPGEAEAQCAQLEQAGLVSGCVTEDSDVWLFGAHTVYRHLFNRDKHVHKYTEKQITNKTGLSREHLILVSMLSGCDYSVGVQGVGAVGAVELLAHFQQKPACFDCTDEALKPLRSLKRWHSQLLGPVATRPSSLVKRHKQAVNWRFPASFPDSGVYEAYLRPNVDTSGEPCRWGRLDADALAAFAHDMMGWPEHKTRQTLRPLTDRQRDAVGAFCSQSGSGGLQTHITSFARNVQFGEPAPLKSQRLTAAMDKLKGNPTTSTPASSTAKRSAQASSSKPKRSIAAARTRQQKRPCTVSLPAQVNLSESDSD